MLRRLDEEGNKAGLTISTTKTKVMRSAFSSPHPVLLQGVPLDDVPEYVYLGRLHNMENDIKPEIARRQPAIGRETLNNGLTPFWEDVDGKFGDGADDVVKSLAKKMLIVDLSSDVKDQAFLAEFRANVVNRVRLPPTNCETPKCLNTTGLTMGRYARHLFDLFFLYGLALQTAGNNYKNTENIVEATVTSFSAYTCEIGLTGEVVINSDNTRSPIFYLYGLDERYDQVALAVTTITREKTIMKKLYTDAAVTVFANRAGESESLQVVAAGHLVAAKYYEGAE
ncbi:hypothetical protein ANCCEY_06520 [Ancylostoma ceylanicum]|uniref:Receptor ligand binding region domain-containing protein n=1 Tax=Ancylostoma ceylanicum TaxID=53326 RepID=A0A0D6LRB4_9BILA|nr:hypothetical protein ANCCEY_06520 [Ancylostoma ceylanicum]